MKHYKHKGLILALIAMMLTAASCSSSSIGINDYKYDDLSKYIKLGNYKGLEYTKTDLNVSKEEIQETIDSALSQGAETEEVKSGTVKEDSVVNIDYVGSIDGVEFEGGTAQGQELDIANSAYIPGFAEAIVGHEVGETFDINVTFPEDYGSEELSGKDAVFKITLNYIVKTKTPKYDDEWVKNNTNFDNKADYEASVKESLEQQKQLSAKSNEENEVFSQINESSEVLEYPEKELKSREEQVKNMYMDAAKQAGISFEDYLAQMGMDADSFNSMAKTSAEQTVKMELILHSIAREEGIEFSDKGYKEYLDNALSKSGYTEEQFKSERGVDFETYAQQNSMFIGYMYETVMEKVMEYSKAK